MQILCFLVVMVLFVVAGCTSPRKPPTYDSRGDGGTGGSSTTITGEGGAGGDLLTGTGGATPGCEGPCVHVHSSPFEGPTMVWIGPTAAAPDCPDNAPYVGFEGFRDLLVEPHQCPACSCSPASCALPELMHASAAKCADAEAASSIAWDLPGWEGVCSAEGAIPAGLQCEGVPCVQSVTIDAPTVEPCKPIAGEVAPFPLPSWGTIARECLITLSDTCPIEGDLCAPAPPEGFALCVYRQGDDPLPECPTAYPHPVVVYAGALDSRICAPCACGEAEGADCAALVSVFSDGACGALLGSYLLTSAMDDACHDLPPGVALGSKEATLTVDKLGACAQSGGEPVGAIEPGGAITYCCQSAPEPPK